MGTTQADAEVAPEVAVVWPEGQVVHDPEVPYEPERVRARGFSVRRTLRLESGWTPPRRRGGTARTSAADPRRAPAAAVMFNGEVSARRARTDGARSLRKRAGEPEQRGRHHHRRGGHDAGAAAPPQAQAARRRRSLRLSGRIQWCDHVRQGTGWMPSRVRAQEEGSLTKQMCRVGMSQRRESQ